MADATFHVEQQQAVCAVRMAMHSMRPSVGVQEPVLVAWHCCLVPTRVRTQL